MLVKKRLSEGKKASVSGALFLIGLYFGVIIAASLYPALVFAGGGSEDAGDLEHKVDLEDQSGINLIIAKLYNDNRLLFALAVTVTMAVVGIIIGQITGVLLRLLGLK
ncbi:MAG: hypothetical protein JSW64_13895 [Candidatus Zixiibacteriota bacterium]|nr:MAG: hypothetical protein JSW64_13895 [candidate division Zixibacteria bacterium]